MGKLQTFLLAAAAAVLTACSGGSDETLSGGGPVGGGAGADVASLTLLTSSPTLPSDGSSDVTITALVRDDNNNVMEGVGIVFSADSGSLVVTQPSTTDANGTVSATLSTGGDPTARTITVSGLAAGSVQATTTVAVAGVTVTIDGPGTLSSGGQGNYTVRVSDDAVNGAGIANTAVSVTASAGSVALQAAATDASGEVDFTYTAGASASATLTATALGTSSVPFNVTISSDTFSFTAPAAGAEIDLGAEEEIQLSWPQGAGGQVTFSTSRGAFTNCAGAALAGNTATMADASTLNPTVCVLANNAGPAVITATNSQNTSIQRNVEFIATVPASMGLQANPGTIGTNEQSTITAIVRDAAGNLVKNQTVLFTLDDVTGGSLSVAQATTNSQGRAQTVYRASTTTSSVNGVEITATVQGFPAVTDTVELTVAQREVFISLGTGNEIFEPNTAQYRKEWVVQITDAQGNGVDGAVVTFGILSQRYWDGQRTFPAGGNSWTTAVAPAAGCPDEDINRNGVLDAGEDANGNNRIEAGNIATAVAQAGGGGTLTTDENGFGIIDIYWPQEYAYYLEVTLEARTTVQGTEFAKATTFVLDGAASDFSNENVAPPGVVSPFGVDGNCASPPPN